MLYRTALTCMLYIGTFVLPANSYALTLEQATYTAIENSPTVMQAIAKYRESKENADLARRNGYYPSVDLAAGIGHETTYGDDDSSDDIGLTRRELSLSLNQPIFSGFATQNEVDRLNSEAEADRWSALISVENVALEVAQAYANILRFRELVNLAEINLDTHQRIYKQIKLKTDTGVGRQSDLSQITARLAKAHANHFAAVNNLRDAESNYNKVVGEMPPKDLIYPVPDRALLPEDLDSAINQALSKNPAIEGAYWDIVATENLQKVTDADKYPDINFVLERTWNNNIDGDEGPNEDLIAMIRLNYNIYSGGSLKRKKQAAVQQNIQATEIRRSTIRDTELTVRLAWAAFEATTGQKKHIRQYVIATKESQVAYEKQFRLGRRTLLDVLDSENELFQARQDYVNADYDELFSEFRLFNAKGELMRAFRIYRPPLLGFEDEFETPQTSTQPKQSATEDLQTLESKVVPVDGLDTTDTSASTESQTPQESELFLEADENSGSW
ncbi:TolC family outer membrane protein [Marinomonas posidonica]|uniref:Type I secretion outer membrane protein, TolC family n=1 Tax=Marinomonas posidonica (strain CECT 7376 / NCIMB 14433 / IVIA-Po-181) TaxID=491952 RepID=F6CUK2_MARPP|nr:TolC family outer membrane protein [Marinomonas posidonica]AEF56422.1 type I secretion outer membrane protein, TolC family [Marinomonas posidonica IVIA-Po-181]